MSESRDILKEEFQDEEYRYAYVEDFLNTSIATQIRVLREQRDLTQADLAEQIGTKQAGISRLENVNYSSWKTETLRKIARAFGLRLRITFEEFGTFLDDAELFRRKSLERRSFDEDPAFHEREAASVTAPTSTAINHVLINPSEIPMLSPKSAPAHMTAQQSGSKNHSEKLTFGCGSIVPVVDGSTIWKELTKPSETEEAIHSKQRVSHGPLSQVA